MQIDWIARSFFEMLLCLAATTSGLYTQLTGWFGGREHPAEDTLAKQIRSLIMHLGCPEKREASVAQASSSEKR
jgi:hypothetical protein